MSAMDIQVDIKDAALLANMQAGGSPNLPPGELQGYASEILPTARPALKPEDEPQKWVQCAKCSLWRKVPFKLRDEDIPDDWSCSQNIWDSQHASCSVPQALTDEEIDEILALQEAVYDAAEAAAMPVNNHLPPEVTMEVVYEAKAGMADDTYGDEDFTLGGKAGYTSGGTPRPSRGNAAFFRRGGGRANSRVPMRGGSRARGRGKRPSNGDSSGGESDGGGYGPGMDTISNGNGGRGGRRRSNQRPVGSAPLSGRGRGGSRGRGAGRARGRIGRGLSQAAEALLGMGGEYDQDEAMTDVVISEDDDAMYGAEPASAYPAGSFRPGRVIWAKVEGHDWWPARVVRRRAVPREVGPPPGGPTRVRTHIPVVFFTAKGIPGEVNDDNHKLGGNPTSVDTEEAEYAWLPIYCLKPFEKGDAAKHAGREGQTGEDANLSACVAAAERALTSILELHDKRAEAAADEDEADSAAESDSDGGWGGPPRQVETAATRSRGRGGRGRRGRGRGGRRGGRGSRRGSRGFDDDNSGSESDLPASQAGDPYQTADALPGQAAGPAKMSVEQIYGWRWPAAEEQPPDRPKDAGGEAEAKAEDKQEEANGNESGLDELMLLAGSRRLSEEPDTAAQVEAGGTPQPEVPARNEPQPREEDEDMAQEEADAVAALMAAASGDIRSEPATDTVDQSPPEAVREAEFLVKWVGKSHAHNEWVAESVMARLAKRKLANFKRRHGAQPCCLAEECWSVPERLVARRPSPTGPGWEVLVKWTGLGYDHSTWEAEGEGVLVQPEYQGLLQGLWARQTAALERASPASTAAAAEAREGAAKQLHELQEQPSWVCGGRLYKHQLAAINILRQRWAGGSSLVLADDSGLGKSTSFITFVHSLRCELKQVGPVLVVAPSNHVDNWHSNWEFWTGPETNVVSYVGMSAARSLIHDHELWLSPESLDSKSSFWLKQGFPSRVAKPDVVVASYEALVSDAASLRALPWDVIAIDERTRQHSTLLRTYQALAAFDSRSRAIIAHPSLLNTGSVENLKQAVAFLEDAQDVGEVLDADLEEMEEGQQLELLRGWVRPRALSRSKAEVGLAVRAGWEARVPLQLSEAQLECYRDVLARRFDVLADPKRPRHSAQRTSEMRALCAELRKVCNHPYLLHHTRPEEEEECEVVGVSTKWQLLDRLVPRLHQRSHRILLLSQSPKALDLVQEWAVAKWGLDCFERIDNSVPAARRYKAVQSFNEEDSKAFLFLLSARACGLGINLPSITAVIILDSDWNARADLQALGRAHVLGPPGGAGTPMRLLRLFMRDSVEEKILTLGERKGGVAAAFRPGSAGGNGTSARGPWLLEEILRWGTERLFNSPAEQPAHRAGPPRDAAGAPRPDPKPEAHAAEQAAAMETEGQADAAAPAGADKGSNAGNPADCKAEAGDEPPPVMNEASAYSDEALDALIRWGTGASGGDASSGSSSKADYAGKSEQGSTDGEAEPEKLDLSAPGLEDVIIRQWSSHDTSSYGSAGEDEEEEEDGETDDGDATRYSGASSAATYWDTLLRQHWEQLEKEEGAAQGRLESSAQSYGEEGEEGTLEGTTGLDLGSARGSEEVPSGRGRLPSRRGAELGKRERRKRRMDDADEDDLNSLDEPPEATKKRRRAGHETPTAVPGGAEARQMKREWARYEAMLGAINDPSTPESYVAKRAHKRLAQLAADLKLSTLGVVELANQAAEVLLMMRPEGEASSDFQEYTLVALFSLAAHLAGGVAAETASLPAMARYYKQDLEVLQQVYDYIMQSLAKYRNMYMDVAALMRSGQQAPDLHAHHDLLASHLPASSNQAVGQDAFGADAGAADGRGNPEDAFHRKLKGIVNADYTELALAAGPLDIAGQVPMLPLPPAHVERSAALLGEYEGVARQIRSSCHQVALLDRIHSIKVKQIQEEYQAYMEGVRATAQGAIDQANALFQALRQDATHTLDTAIHYLQNRFFSMQALGRQGEAGNGAVAGEGTADAAGDKAGTMPSYSTAMGQLQRAEDDAARQGASLTGVNQQQYWAPLVAKPGTADAATQAGGFAGAQGLATSAAAAAAAAAAGSQRSPTFRPPMPANPKPPGQAPGAAAAKGPTTGAVGGGPGWSFPAFSSTPLSGTSGFGTHQNFLQPPSAPPLQQQQVVLARQLANQPSQLPLQRLTSEQMQQLQLQVQDHHQRQRQGPPNSVQSGAGAMSMPEQSWMQGYNHLIESAGGRPGATDPRFAFAGLPQLQAQAQEVLQRESQVGKDAALASSPGLDLASLTRIAVKPAPAAAPSAQLQQQQQQQQQQQGALAASAAQAVQTPQSVADMYAGMATSQALATSGARPPPSTQSAQVPAQQPSSNGTPGVGTTSADLSNVRVDPLGRPTSIDKEHQVLLEATAKGSFGARMPRHQQPLPSALMRPGSHMHADPGPHRARAPPPKPIATGVRGGAPGRVDSASERSPHSATARSSASARDAAAGAFPGSSYDGWKAVAPAATAQQIQQQQQQQQQQQRLVSSPALAAAMQLEAAAQLAGSPTVAGSRSPSPSPQQGPERLGLAAQQRVAKAVVQTGERPDFERATSSGAPARPGPITSGVPQHRLDQPTFRISAPFLDAPVPPVLPAQEYQAAVPRQTSSPATVTLQLAQAAVPISAPPQRPLQQHLPRQDAAPQQLLPQPADDWAQPAMDAAAAASAAMLPESGPAAPPLPQGQASFMEQLAMADQDIGALGAAPRQAEQHGHGMAEQGLTEGLLQAEASNVQLPDLAVPQHQHHF